MNATFCNLLFLKNQKKNFMKKMICYFRFLLRIGTIQPKIKIKPIENEVFAVVGSGKSIVIES